MACIILINTLTNPFSYERKGHTAFTKSSRCVGNFNNFFHFCQIIFLNSFQAPKKEQALFQPLTPSEQTHWFHLSLLRVLSVHFADHRAKTNCLQSTMNQFASAQRLSLSYIHHEVSNLFINWHIPGPHVSLIVHISRWRFKTFVIIDLYSLIPLIKALHLEQKELGH